MFIGKSRKEQRVLHWKEIKARTRTHEGEMLTGNKGRSYQKKYSASYLGVDMSKPTDFSKPEYQKELNK